MKLNYKVISQKIEPYKGVIYFIIILLASHFFWKFTVRGDESESVITFFNIDITAPFAFMAKHLTKATAGILNFFGLDVQIARGNVLYYDNGNAVRIVASCTALKQAYIFFCIIAFTRGPWKKKLWYIPLGLVAIHVFNLIRLGTIVGLCKNHFEWFEFLHTYLFKYLFYGLIFFMWVIWDEKFAVKYSLKKKQKTDKEISDE